MKILRIILGCLCGIAATGPMSAVMVLLHRRLPERERYPLPPREITAKAVSNVTEPDAIAPATRSALTWLAHFGYGGAAGVLYAQACSRLPGGAAVRGPFFGLMVWTVSYLGLLPGLRILKSATQHPLRRNALMIGAHLVWGAFLGSLYQVFQSDLGRESPAFAASHRTHLDTARRGEAISAESSATS